MGWNWIGSFCTLMFSLRSQLCSSLSNSKAGYLSRLPSANRFASALPCTSVSTKGGNLCIVLRLMWQAVTVLVCWSVLCLDCLHFIVLLGWILSKISHCVEFSGAHVLDHRIYCQIYIIWKISHCWTCSVELLSARTKHFITTNCFSVKCWWGNTCSDN